MSLTFNPGKLWSRPTRKQNFKVNGQSVPKIERKQTDEQTDGRMDGGECITSHANAIGTNRRCVLCVFNTW